MKKILLTLGSTLLTVAPISFAISCGSKPKVYHQETSKAKNDVNNEHENGSSNIISGNSESTDIGSESPTTHNSGFTIREQDIHISSAGIALVEVNVSNLVSSLTDEQINSLVDSIKNDANILKVNQLHLVLTNNSTHKEFLVNIETSKAIDKDKMKEAFSKAIIKDINADELQSLINLVSSSSTSNNVVSQIASAEATHGIIDFSFPQQGKQSVEEIWHPIFRDQSQILHVGERLKLNVNGKLLMHVLTDKDVQDLNELIAQARQEPMVDKVVELLKASSTLTNAQIKNAMGLKGGHLI